MKGQTQEKWWIVVINLGGITGPILCHKKAEYSCWDCSGNWDCSMEEGLFNDRGIKKFQTKDQDKAKLFALGAKTLATHLIEYLT